MTIHPTASSNRRFALGPRGLGAAVGRLMAFQSIPNPGPKGKEISRQDTERKNE